MLNIPPSDELLAKLESARDSGSAVTVGTTSIIILPRNPERNIATIINDSNVDVYAARGPVATVYSGIRINAGGGAWTFGLLTDDPWLGHVAVVAPAGGARVLITEV